MLVMNMEVGPSAPPMMPIEAASCEVKPSQTAPMKVANTPNCAAPPRMRVFGRAMSGPKSVRAPTPRKMSGGKISSSTPICR